MVGQSWARGYKTFFMLSSAEHEIYQANKYLNANNLISMINTTSDSLEVGH